MRDVYLPSIADVSGWEWNSQPWAQQGNMLPTMLSRLVNYHNIYDKINIKMGLFNEKSLLSAIMQTWGWLQWAVYFSDENPSLWLMLPHVNYQSCMRTIGLSQDVRIVPKKVESQEFMWALCTVVMSCWTCCWDVKLIVPFAMRFVHLEWSAASDFQKVPLMLYTLRFDFRASWNAYSDLR